MFTTWVIGSGGLSLQQQVKHCNSSIFSLLSGNDKLKEELGCHQQPPYYLHTHMHIRTSFIRLPVLSCRWWKGWAGGSQEGITIMSYINSATPSWHLSLPLSHTHIYTSWCNRSIMFDLSLGTALWQLWLLLLPSPPSGSLVWACIHTHTDTHLITHTQSCQVNRRSSAHKIWTRIAKLPA